MSPQYSRGARPESDHANFSLNHIDDDDGDDDYDEDNDDDDDDGGLLSSSRSLSSTPVSFSVSEVVFGISKITHFISAGPRAASKPSLSAPL